MTLYTARYQNFKPSMGVAVRITLGRPRFFAYELTEEVKELWPVGRLFDIQDQAEFEAAYFARLDKLGGVPRLRRRFADIASRHDTLPLILCCFEDVVTPRLETGQPDWCHRRSFARYWIERTGEDVPEVQPSNRPPPKQHRETSVSIRDGAILSDMTEEWLTPDDVAAYMKVSRHTVLRWAREGAVPAYEMRTGGGVRFKKEDVDALMQPRDPANAWHNVASRLTKKQ